MTIFLQKVYAWLVHIFTASGAVFGLLALNAIHHNKIQLAFGFMALTIVIDAIDGSLARQVDIKRLVKIDGALLDNIVDFLNYVIVPAFMVVTIGVVRADWQIYCVIMIVMASCYQFCQTDAKTDDHFFKGFPSYWNIALFYLYYWQTSMQTNEIIIMSLTVLTFIPIKYIYPSRMTYISTKKIIIKLMFIATIVWGVATVALLITYPAKRPFLNIISIAYILLYFGFSIYRTFKPIEMKKHPKFKK